jgi:hypothetical protein
MVYIGYNKKRRKTRKKMEQRINKEKKMMKRK